jgi:hypothetical protein
MFEASWLKEAKNDVRLRQPVCVFYSGPAVTTASAIASGGLSVI